jgi:hypothetical protein
MGRMTPYTNTRSKLRPISLLAAQKTGQNLTADGRPSPGGRETSSFVPHSRSYGGQAADLRGWFICGLGFLRFLAPFHGWFDRRLERKKEEGVVGHEIIFTGSEGP